MSRIWYFVILMKSEKKVFEIFGLTIEKLGKAFFISFSFP